MDLVNLNGHILKKDKAFLPIDDHSYRYGDGLFETIKVKNNTILLSQLHFERLMHGLQLLQLPVPKSFSAPQLEKEILQLCRQNNCESHARVRLSVSGGQGGIFDGNQQLQYLIECWPLNDTTGTLNENGLVIDIYTDIKKSCDVFSNLKSSSYLPYVMGARFAKANKLNDCLILNVHNRICDATIANVFWIKNDNIYTPPLSEGCVAGVMRKYLIEKFAVEEKPCTANDILNADEIFLTNAIQNLRWVRTLKDKDCSNKTIQKISKELSI